jgi:hypothetical protein
MAAGAITGKLGVDTLVRRKFTGVSQVLTISATAARSTQLARGRYRLSATGTCWLRQGDATVTAAVETEGSHLLGELAIDDVCVEEPDKDGYISVIGASGKLCIGEHE